MANEHLEQTELTIGGKPTQPPFPGGWVLAVFDALRTFAPEVADKNKLPISRRTEERIKAAEKNIKATVLGKIQGPLIRLVEGAFPEVSKINGFAAKYVNEYFRLWQKAVQHAPEFGKCFGNDPAESGVQARALFRDLLLRLCYLEVCERTLKAEKFSEAELELLGHDIPSRAYASLLQLRWRKAGSLEALSEELGITVKSIQRIRKGTSLPGSRLLRAFEAGPNQRVALGIGLADQLLKTLRLDKTPLRSEFMAIAGMIFRACPPALTTFRGRIWVTTAGGKSKSRICGFREYVPCGDNLLLHPGFDEVWNEMPDALWRAHLYTLQYARIPDLADAYSRYAAPEDESQLESFLLSAESDSSGSPYAWMDKLMRPKA